MRHILKMRWSDVCPWPMSGMFLSKFWVIAEVQPMRNQKTTRRITDSILITLPPVIYGIRWAVRDRNTFKTLKNSDSAELRRAVVMSQELDLPFILVPDYLKNKSIVFPLTRTYKNEVWNIITFILITFKWNRLLPRECYIAIIENISYAYVRGMHLQPVLSSCFIHSISQWKTSVFERWKVISIKQQPSMWVFILFWCCLLILNPAIFRKQINTS